MENKKMFMNFIREKISKKLNFAIAISDLFGNKYNITSIYNNGIEKDVEIDYIIGLEINGNKIQKIGTNFDGVITSLSFLISQLEKESDNNVKICNLQGEVIIESQEIEGTNFGKEDLVESLITIMHQEEGKIKNVDLSNLKFDNFNVTGIDFENISFENTTFVNSTFEDCSFLNINAINSNFQKSQFKNCKLDKIFIEK